VNSELKSKLLAAVNGRDSLDLGQFQLLNLDMVKREAGKDWARLRKKIYSVASHFIEKRLHKEDLLVDCQGGFVLVFADVDEAEALARVQKISAEMNLFFLGDRILKHLQVKAQVRKISMDALERFIGELTAGAPIVDPREPLKPEEPDSPSARARWQAGPKACAARAASWATVEGRAGGSGEASWCGEHSHRAEEETARWVCDAPVVAGDEEVSPFDVAPTEVNAERAHLEAAREAHEKASAQTALDGWHDIVAEAECPNDLGLPEAVFTDPGPHWDDIIFKPCFDAKRLVVSSHFCLPRRVHGGQALYGRDTLLGECSPDIHRALDRAVAIAAQRGFQQLFASGVRCAIVIPVHYDTIQGVQDRVSYFSILQSVPQHLRNHFYLRIDDIPAGAPVGQMQELFRSMKCFGSRLLAKIDFDSSDLANFEGCGVDLFGSETPPRLNSKGATEPDIQHMVGRTEAALAQGAETYLTQVSNFEVLNAGVAAGIRYFSGPAVGVEAPLPGPVTPLSFDDLRKRELARVAKHAETDTPRQRQAG
jgi:hypothetical protein